MTIAKNASEIRNEVYRIIKNSEKPLEIDTITKALAEKHGEGFSEELKSRVQGALLMLSKYKNIEHDFLRDPSRFARKKVWSAIQDPVQEVKDVVLKPKPAERASTPAISVSSSAHASMYVQEKTTALHNDGITILLKTAPVPLHNVLKLEVETPSGERVPMPAFDDMEAILTREMPDFSEDRYISIRSGFKLLCTVPVAEAQKHFKDIESRKGKLREGEIECVVIAIPVSPHHIAVLAQLSDEEKRRYAG